MASSEIFSTFTFIRFSILNDFAHFFTIFFEKVTFCQKNVQEVVQVDSNVWQKIGYHVILLPDATNKFDGKIVTNF